MTQSLLKVCPSQKILISAGSNPTEDISDATELLLKGQKAISAALEAEVVSSTYYRTPAFPKGSDPDYANAVFVAETRQDPQQILAMLHRIEQTAGRVRTLRWGQRTLDLDLISYGNLITPSPDVWTHWRELPLNLQMKRAPKELILPHPRVQDRAFVLVPLVEIAPDWRHPVTGRSAQAMLAALAPGDIDAVKPLD